MSNSNTDEVHHTYSHLGGRSNGIDSITKDSKLQALKFGAMSILGCFGMHYSLMAPPVQKVFPYWAAIGRENRVFGYVVIVFLSTMYGVKLRNDDDLVVYNTNKMHDVHNEEVKFLEQWEADQIKKNNNKKATTTTATATTTPTTSDCCCSNKATTTTTPDLTPTTPFVPTKQDNIMISNNNNNNTITTADKNAV